MANLFRRKSLEKLSSPEQLDKLIVINSPLVWIALSGGAFIIIVTLLWAIIGRVPITEEGQGILLNSGNVTSIYAKTQGVVTKSYISSGDKVAEGDILYEVNSAETAKALLQLETRIEKVDAVTLDSKEDEVTSDNQSLLDIKGQITALESGSISNEINLSQLEQQYAGKVTETKRLKAEKEAAETKYYNALAADDSSKIEYEYQGAATEYQAAESTYQNANTTYQTVEKEAEEYKAKWEEYKKLYKENKDSEGAASYLSAVEEYKQYYQAAKKTLEESKNSLNEAETERDSQKALYEEKKQAYEGYINDVGNTKSDLTKLLNEYNTALSLYSAAKSEMESYETQITSLKTQEKVDTETQNIQKETLTTQFKTTKEAILDSLYQEKNNYELLQNGSNILATVSGTVYSTFAANGSALLVDSEVARINTESEGKLYAIYYMDLETGKNVKEGMEVSIYPANVSKEEYGHMKGTVVSVSNYVASYADLFAKLGDDTLAGTFTKDGAVIEVSCELDTDESTASGFAWSSKKGATLELSEGTLLAGSVITENVAPIAMFIPKLKEKFNLE